MTWEYKKYAPIALKKALKTRSNFNIPVRDSFCVFDLVTKQLGFEVRFIDLPSFEGMYVLDAKKQILLGSHRPDGRQRFTCAHELGHHYFDHGEKIDEVKTSAMNRKKDEKEIAADLYASFLLMPATTVGNGFHRRGWDLRQATPLQTYTVASWLGVGYSTLIKHLRFGLKKITSQEDLRLSKITPKFIKEEIMGTKISPLSNVIPVDEHWSGRPVDLRIGDYVVLEQDLTTDCPDLTHLGQHQGKSIYRADSKGISSIYSEHSDWAIFVRITQESYVGLSKYRHLGDE